ncbi:MAG: TIR domain-containing protein [Lachnospiraceae bacterium]|nr:TIR domain-containing protein [Lachnospiraceae bacterium]
MERKYNAFISYRHAEADTKVASEIQKGLERFNIPRAIQKKTGVKRIERIFRDKEELPITVDLNNDIDIALKESQHLIVICSTRTSESIWVQKEIETFLNYHSKKNIFTVLVDGDPEEVIPDILLHDTVTRKLADGTLETREEIIEPLSCDYRISIRKAHKIELPRLVASMIGCSYDELVQRRRQYLRRRNAMIATTAAVFASCAIGYLSWSLFQIGKNYDLAQFNYALAQENYSMAQANYETAQANYMESLRNQSVFLASESVELMNEHDKVAALQLALAALPSESDPRPVTVEAEYALANALGCYIAPGYLEVDPVWKYNSGYEIQEFDFCENTMTLVAIDKEGNVTSWNMQTHEEIREFDPEANDILITEEGLLYIVYSDRIICYGPDMASVVWEAAVEEGHYSVRDNGVLRYLPATDELFYMGLEYISVFDAHSGQEKEGYTIGEMTALDSDEVFFSELTLDHVYVSGDGRYIVTDIIVGFDTRSIFVMDREESVWNLLAEGIEYINAGTFTPDGKYMTVLSYDTNLSSFSMGQYQNLVEGNRTVALFDPESCKLVWSCEMPTTLIAYNADIAFCDYVCAPGEDPIETAAVMISNRCTFIERSSGRVVAVRELPSSYVSSYLNTSGRGMIFILRNGQYCYLSLTEPGDYMTVDPYFISGVTDTRGYSNENGDNVFLVGYERYIIEYDAGVYDKDAHLLADGARGVNIESSFISGNRIIVMDGSLSLYCYDMDAGSLVWQNKAEGKYSGVVEFLCTGPDGNVYYRTAVSGSASGEEKLARLNMSDGSTDIIYDISEYDTTHIDAENGHIYWTELGDSVWVKSLDLSTGDISSLELAGEEARVMASLRMDVSPDGKRAIYTGSSWLETSVYLVSYESGDLLPLSEEEMKYVSWIDSSDRFLIGNDRALDVYDQNGNHLLSVGDGHKEILKGSLCEKGVVVIYMTGQIIMYDYDGNVIDSVNVDLLKSFLAERTEFHYAGDELIISLSGYASVIDMNEFKIRASLVGFLGYYEDGRRYFVETPQSTRLPSVVMFDRKTVEELISEGREYLGNAEMSDEMRRRYGID